jgi:hypothetical protein
MRQRVAWQLAGVAVVLLSGAGVSRAAVQGQEWVYWLGTGDWQLCEKEGGVCLVESHWDRSDGPPRNQRGRWYVSAPTIKAESGKFLASDPAGRTPSVSLVSEKGAHTRWVFVFVARLAPGRAEGQSKGVNLKDGPSGFTFRVKAAEGPFQNWYLAAEEPTTEPDKGKGGEAVARPLKLVPDVKKATVFTYIEENYYVDHK